MPSFKNDDERFEYLKNAMAGTYATGPVRARSPMPRAKRAIWFVLGGCLVIAIFGAVIGKQWLSAMQYRAQDGTQPEAVAYTPLPPLPNTPQPKPVIVAQQKRPSPKPHTPSPSTPAPTATPSPESTSSPTSAPSPSASPSPVATAVAVIHNAFLLVHSNGMLKVGKKGSCGGLDVTVEVRGYPKGCTVFDADSTGPLANGRGTVLVVPVSTTEDVSNVAFGLVYFRSNDADAPHFVGLIRGGDGDGPVVVRLHHGFIMMEQNGSDTRFFTFNGHRIVRARGPAYTGGPED